MCDFDGENARYSTTGFRAARKTHKCDACREIIPKGAKHWAISAVWDDGWETFRHCLRCHVMAEAIYRRTGDSPDIYLDCGETWQDALGEEPPPDVARLAFLLPHEYGELLAKAEKETGERDG